MTIHTLYNERFTRTPELKALAEERRLLEDKYREPFTLTEDDISDKWYYEGSKAGDVGTQDPELPNDLSERWSLFHDFFAKRKFIDIKMMFLDRNEEWDLLNVEDELQYIEDFIFLANKNIDKDIAIEYRQKANIFRKFKEGYYNKFSIGLEHDAIEVYAKYILFHDFLLEKIDEFYSTSSFSKIKPTQQLDLILNVFRDTKKSKNNRFQIAEIQKLMVNNNENIPIYIIRSIIKKLVKDKYVDEVTLQLYKLPFYEITFEGKIFVENNGYCGLDDEIRYQKKFANSRDKLLVQGSWIAGIGTAFLGLVEVIKYWKWVSSIEFWTSFFVLLCINLVALIMYLFFRQIKSIKK